MDEHVYWLLELRVGEGQGDALRALMEEMVTSTKSNEPGALDYLWSIAEDGRTCHIFERYVDNAAVMAHLGTFGEKFAQRFMAILSPTRLTLYGAPSDEVQKALAMLSPVVMRPLGGFTR
jgi:quinol monooxygenase YgiN